MKLLHLDASIQGDASISRQVSAAIVARLREQNPDLKVRYRDLTKTPLHHMTLAHLMPGEAEPPADAELSKTILEEFMLADIVVIGAPMYNFTIPSQLKAWIDRILIAGKTFQYTEDGGAVGLAGDKQVYIALSRGGMYGPDSPALSFEHAETYLRSAFAFIGIDKPHFVIAEGSKIGPEQHEQALTGALQKAAELQTA